METTPHRSEKYAPPPRLRCPHARLKKTAGSPPRFSLSAFLPRWPAALLACWLTGLLACWPADAAVRFDMFVGYDGIVPQGSWFPIAFEVQNDGPAFTATVEVSPGQFTETQTRTMVVELPTGTTKRFIIPTFSTASYNPAWNARLLDERGKVRAETMSQRVRRLNEAAVPLAAAITRAMPPLPELKTRQDENPLVERCVHRGP